MKKYILLLIVPFLSFGQTPTGSTEILNVSDLLDYYPNYTGSGYYDINDELLFDGGEFDANSPDAKKVFYWEIYLFHGEPMNSDAVHLKFWAWPSGNTQFASLEFFNKEKGEFVLKFEKNEKNEMIFE